MMRVVFGLFSLRNKYVFLVVSCLFFFFFVKQDQKNTIIMFEKESYLWFYNGERMDQSEGVSPWQSQSPHLNSFNCCIADKKTVLCQKPLTHNRDQIMSHTSVRGYIFQQWVIFIMDEIRKMQYNKQANVDLLTLLPIKYHITHITIHQLQSFMLECIVELCLWSYWKALSTCYWGGNLI